MGLIAEIRIRSSELCLILRNLRIISCVCVSVTNIGVDVRVICALL